MCVFYVREDIIPMYTLLLHGIYALNGASFKIPAGRLTDRKMSSQDWVSTIIVAVKFYSHLTNSAVGMLEKLNSDTMIMTPNLALAHFRKFGGNTSYYYEDARYLLTT